VDLVAYKTAGPSTEGAYVSFKESPESEALGRSAKTLLTLLKEFGLTPRSRLDVRSLTAANQQANGLAYWEAKLGTEG
jgi:hypothetical protein